MDQSKPVSPFPIPVKWVGPGSQPAETDFEYLSLPKEMNVWRAPEIPDSSVLAVLSEGKKTLQIIDQALQKYQFRGATQWVDLKELDPSNLSLVNQILGEGEVAARSESGALIEAQESIFPGVWRIREYDNHSQLICDQVEIAPVPTAILERAKAHAQPVLQPTQNIPAFLMNAPAVYAELLEKSKQYLTGTLPSTHVINLTLLPMTADDLNWLYQQLGQPGVVFLSRGYGNCRINSTAIPGVWQVVYYNSQDKIILNTIEVCVVPEVACVAKEDFEDTRHRFAEVLAWVET